MQPFTFDITTLSPAHGLPVGAHTNPRPRARFEDHLGQVTSAPPEFSHDHQPRESQPEPAAARTYESSESRAGSPDDAADHERSKTAEEQVDDRKAAEAQESTSVAAAEKPASAEESPDGQEGDDPVEPGSERSAGKLSKSKGKTARASLPTDGGAAASDHSAKQVASQRTEETTADATARQGVTEQSAEGKANARSDRLPRELDAGHAPTGEASAISAAGVAATVASQPSVATDASAIDHAAVASAIGAPPAESAEKSEPTAGGKRVRGAKAAALSDATGSQGETAALALEPNTAAADAVDTGDAAEIAATIEAPAKHDTAGDGAPSSAANDNADVRPNAATTSAAARQEGLQETSGRTEGLTEAERVRFVQRVARAFHSMGDEGGEVRLRLSPPELGSLRLEVSVRDGVLSARLEAETASARNLLLDNLPALRERLAEQNIKVERFEVDVRDEQRQPSQEHLPGQDDVPRQGQRDRPRGHATRRATAIAQVTSRGGIRNDSTGELNIVI